MGYNPLQMQPSKHQLTISLTAKVQAVHRAEARHLRCFWGQDWKNGPNLFKQLGTVAGFSPSTVKIGQLCIKTAIVIVKVFSQEATQSKNMAKLKLDYTALITQFPGRRSFGFKKFLDFHLHIFNHHHMTLLPTIQGMAILHKDEVTKIGLETTIYTKKHFQEKQEPDIILTSH